MNINDKIITFIKKNRVSTTEVADALGKKGVLPNILPIYQDQHRVGKVRCVFTAFESNYAIHEQVRDVNPGEVVVVFTHECGDRAIFGNLVVKYMVLYRGAEAVVVDGPIRDVSATRRDYFPVWSNGVTPLGCFNTEVDPFPSDLQKEIINKYEGGIAVCDDGGVVVIPPGNINEETLERLHRIEMQEDIWFFCLDTLKWDTKKIVCDKQYLTETDLLSSVHIEQLKDLSKPLD